MAIGLMNDKRAVSEVIATVIIVAVTISVAIAVAFWMGGLAPLLTRFEKIEFKNIRVAKQGNQFTITIDYINTGAATAIDSITVNGVPVGNFNPALSLGGDSVNDPICPTGVTKKDTITFYSGAKDPSGNILTSGVVATVNLHTTGGKDYYTSLFLP